MNKFQVRFRPSARRELEALPDRVLQRVFSKIEALAAAPRPVGCKKLTNSDDLWRIRVGDYRVVYSIDDRAFAVIFCVFVTGETCTIRLSLSRHIA